MFSVIKGRHCKNRLLMEICSEKINMTKDSAAKKMARNANQNVMCMGLSLNSYNISNYTASGTLWNSKALISKERIDSFMAMYPDIVKDLTNLCKNYEDIPEVGARFPKFIHHVIPNGKYLRAFLLMATYEMVEKEENLTPENLRLATIMSWMLELIQGCVCTMDDIMDHSEIRRGVPCWYKKDNIGLSAINDFFCLEQGVYLLLKKHFSEHHCYLPTIELMHYTTLQASKAQVLDCLGLKNKIPNFEIYTMDKFNYIIDYGTSHLTFQMSIVLALYMSNLYDTNLHEQVGITCRKIGKLYKMQEDYMDCFGDPKEVGKRGNDIREGKPNWFAVMALQKANPSQKRIMEEFYGRSDTGAITTILNLYKELNLLEIYSSCLEDTLNEIRNNIYSFSQNSQLRQLFFKLIDALYDRKC